MRSPRPLVFPLACVWGNEAFFVRVVADVDPTRALAIFRPDAIFRQSKLELAMLPNLDRKSQYPPLQVDEMMEWWGMRHDMLVGAPKNEIVQGLADFHHRFLRIHPFLEQTVGQYVCCWISGTRVALLRAPARHSDLIPERTSRRSELQTPMTSGL